MGRTRLLKEDMQLVLGEYKFSGTGNGIHRDPEMGRPLLSSQESPSQPVCLELDKQEGEWLEARRKGPQGPPYAGLSRSQ